MSLGCIRALRCMCHDIGLHLLIMATTGHSVLNQCHNYDHDVTSAKCNVSTCIYIYNYSGVLLTCVSDSLKGSMYLS